MRYEQLFIDGVPMDTDEKTDITLELKSNLLADISKLSSNHSYTVKLPKTVHNLTVLGHADRASNPSTWPYAFHSARFFRNGVEIIKDGRAALLSATDTLEIVIVWGLASPFNALKENDLKLNDLGGNEYMTWGTSNDPETPAAFLTRGYGYAGYSPWINEKEDEGWQGTDVTHNTSNVVSYTAISGYSIDTGEAIGDIALLNPQAKANWGYLVLPFHLTSLVIMNHVAGGAGNNRLWSVLDAYDRVIKIADANASLQSVVVDAPTNAAKIVINLDLSLSQQNYATLSESVSVGTAISFGGASGNIGLKYIHPSASVAWILNKIQAKTGVSCVWSGAAKTLIDNLAIPLVNKKASAAVQSLSAYALLQPMTALGSMSVEIQGANDIFTETPNTIVSQLTIARDCGISLDVRGTWSWDASAAVSNSSTDARYNGTSRSMYQYIYFVNYIEMTVTKGNGDTETYIIGRESAPDAHMIDQKANLNNGRFIHTIAGYGHIDLQQGDIITFELKNHSGELDDMRFSDGRIDVAIDSSDEVLKGNNFPIVENLPEIKVPDFIKFLAAITGTYPLQDTQSSTITFVDIATIFGNKGIALDWTRKVIPSYNNDKPKELEYKIDDWAQSNWFRWAEDDRVTGEYDGEITITDATLEATRDIYVFPFAASDGRSVPTYTRGKINGIFGAKTGEGSTEPQYSACKPRILSIRTDDNGKAELYFDLNMQTVISNKYTDLVSVLQSAKVIKDNIRLSNIEILNFNEQIPIYLAQHGAYFAVLEIKAASNGTAEVTMLKL